MKILLILFLVHQLFSCASSKETTNNLQDIHKKITTYRQLSELRNLNGYIYPEDCDSLVFTGLYGAAGGKVDIRDYQTEDGLFLRRPKRLPDCYFENLSQSQCSRDTYLSVFEYLWFSDYLPKVTKLDIANKIWTRGAENDWIMCEGVSTRTKLSKGLIGTLAWIIYKLGGDDHSERTNPLYTIAPTGAETGFERHLAVNHAYLRADLTGRMPIAIGLVIGKFVDSQPQNPLYQAVFHKYDDGNQEKAIELLTDESMWPNDSLPTSSNYCEKWVIQRDYGEDWKPCPEENKTHSGADFLWSTNAIVK